jgi:hypothetical protein
MWGERIVSTFITKDSGKREDFDSGAKRDTQEGKPRYDLVPPLALKRVAELYARGAVKYGAHNWSKGIQYSRCFASLLRHAYQWAVGEKDEDHLAAVVFNSLCIMHFESAGRDAELNDMWSMRQTAPTPQARKRRSVLARLRVVVGAAWAWATTIAR